MEPLCNAGQKVSKQIDVMRPGQASEKNLVSHGKEPTTTSARWEMRTSVGTIDLTQTSGGLWEKLSSAVLRAYRLLEMTSSS